MALFRPADHRILVSEEAEGTPPLGELLGREGYPIVRTPPGAVLETALVAGTELVILCLGERPLASLEVCRRLRAERRLAHLAIVVLTSHGGEADRIAAFEAGADDCLIEPVSIPELLLRMRARLAARPTRPAPVRGGTARRFSELEIQPDAFRVTVAGTPVHLSAQEFRVLLALVAQSGQVVSRKQLESVSGRRRRPARRAIDSQIKRLRRKLGAASRFIQTVRGSGYRFTPPPAC
jgi:two-component system phosphate regulon response regulator PhoB